MARRYANHLCVYCQQAPSVPRGDHVFARAFFPEDQRSNLPIAPGCEKCGSEKSQLETYLTATLPFGGSDLQSLEMQAAVAARLAKNQKLARELAAGFKDLGDMGATLPLEGKVIRKYFALAVRGLMWHHWRRYLPAEYETLSILRGPGGELMFQTLMSFGARDRVTGDFGDGLFAYQGMAANEDPHLTAWKIEFFNGLRMSGDPSSPDTIARGAGILTAPKDSIARYRVHLGVAD
jgi:hypothetical protein